MGKNMVLRLLENGISVVAWNRSQQPVNEVVAAGAEAARDLADLAAKLETPRIVWLMLPAGEVVDDFILKLAGLFSLGDLVIDGGNSFYKDSIRRGQLLKKKGVSFMDIGVSGGPAGARNGACLMVGGDGKDYQRVKDLIEAAAAPNAYALLGPVGAGHFAKMVHNGIEYGMMEAIAEGAAVLRQSHFNFNLGEVFNLYNQGSVIASRLTGWMAEVLKEDPQLSEVSSAIDRTGEGEWTVITAQELGAGVPVISDSLKVRVDSKNDPQDSPQGFRNKAVSALRGKFGGHSVKVDKART